MAIERVFEPDFRAKAICEFLKTTSEVGDTFSTQLDVVAEWSALGYELKSSRDIHSRPFPQRTFLSTNFEVSTRAGRLLHTINVTDPVDHATELRVTSLLLIHNELNHELSAEMQLAFVNADFDDVDSVEQSFLAKGVSAQDYQVVFAFDLVRLDRPQQRRINIQAFEEQMRRATDADGNPLYVMSDGGKQSHLCDAPAHIDDPQHVVIADPDDPIDAIAAVLKDRHPSCDDLHVTDHRIGTAFQYYEWKTEWEMRDVRVGRCRIMRTKLPIVYHRVSREALWGYAATERSLSRYFEKALKACLIEAAVSTAVIAIVTGGMGLAAAVATFSSACQQCIERKISDVVQCLFSGLKLVKETGDWREGIL